MIASLLVQQLDTRSYHPHGGVVEEEVVALTGRFSCHQAPTQPCACPNAAIRVCVCVL